MTDNFDYSIYEDYRKIADSMLNNVPWCHKGAFTDWAIHQLPLIKELADDDNFEACKAVKDACIEYINKYITNEEDKISLNAMIKFNKLK